MSFTITLHDVALVAIAVAFWCFVLFGANWIS